MTNPAILIKDRLIGPDHPPYIIAEMSGNHNGDINKAFDIMISAKSAGADAIKLQTYTADTITIDHDTAEFRISDGLWKGLTLFQLYQKAHTPWEWHQALFAKGRELGITVFSSPFDLTAVDFLEDLNVPAYKIASFEMVDHSLIEKVASTRKPIILSTGMANLAEITEAVETAKNAGCQALSILHCTSGYPVPPEEANLRTLSDLANKFPGNVIGLSDHTLGTAISTASVALGASIIEKHITLSRDDGGPDSAFSLEPSELSELTKTCKMVWSSLGKADYERKPSEAKNVIFRRSLYIVEDIKPGEHFTDKNLRSIRPGYGLQPKYLSSILGKKSRQGIKRGTALSWSMVDN
jgi:pseudaminic acid synthase